jgi:DNA-directed RNA polymerase specialized sigma subunit
MTLPLQLRAVYIGIYVRDLSQREVARQMRISQPRVAQLHDELLRLGRARFAALSVAA